MNNITHIVQQKLCANCGACVAICPQKAITIEFDSKNFLYYPKIDATKCNNCGLCLKACPGKEIFGRDTTKNILKAWLVYSKDSNVRLTGQSGGVISQLLINALTNKIINGAIVTRVKDTNSFLADNFIARNKQEILEAARSKYWPIPVDAGISKVVEGDKLIFVGTPCQITGIKKICAFNKLINNSIFLYFGLVCGGALNLAFPEMIYEIIGLSKSERKNITAFDYRFKDDNHPWPGYLRVKFKNKDIFLPNRVRGALKRFFLNERCKICLDKLNQPADLVFGDSYVKGEFQDEKGKGISLVFARTQQGLQFFEENKNLTNLEVKEINLELVLSSTKVFKTRKLAQQNIPVYEKLYAPELKRWRTDKIQQSLFFLTIDYYLINLFKKKMVRRIFSKFLLWRIMHKLLSIKDKYFLKING